MATPPPYPPAAPGPAASAVPARATGELGVPSWLSKLGTVTLVVVCYLSTFISAPYGAMGFDDSTIAVIWAAVGLGVGAGVAVFLVFRRRYPVPCLLVAGVGAILLPIDAIGALVALSWVIGSQRPRTWRWAIPLGALASGVYLLRDALRPAQFTVLALHPAQGTTGEHVAAPGWVYLLLWILGLALAILMGWVRRSQAAVSVERATARRQTQVSSELRGEVARQEEREQFAREVHDTLAHRLSLVSLHSGALEVSAPEDLPELREAAQVVRVNARQSLEDLRDLVAQLRDPSGAASTPDGASLAGLPELLAHSRDAGMPLVATVLLGDVDRASPRLTRAVYRILQECLTNVHKHAPGAAVDVELRGGAPDGISLRVSNALRPVTVPLPGSGTGLIGIGERARLLGGEAQWGPQGDRFVVSVHLPWSASSST